MVDNLFCGHVACYCIILRKKLKSCQLYLNFLNKDWMCLPLHIGCDFYHCLQKRGDVFVLSWKDWSSLFVLSSCEAEMPLDWTTSARTRQWWWQDAVGFQVLAHIASSCPACHPLAPLSPPQQGCCLSIHAPAWTDIRDCPEQVKGIVLNKRKSS